MNNLAFAKLSTGIAVGILAGIGLGFEPSNAAVFTQPTKLSQLIGNTNQFLVDDKLFSNFSYATSGNATPDDPADVTISGFSNSPTEQGIRISGAFSSNSPNGDIALGYTVTALDPNFLIKDAQLGIFGISSGQITIVENLVSGGNQIGSLLVNNAKPIDTTVFAPVRTITVAKNIELRAEGGVPDSFSITDQLFSQTTVPEPTAVLALLGLGSLGLFKKGLQKSKK